MNTQLFAKPERCAGAQRLMAQVVRRCCRGRPSQHLNWRFANKQQRLEPADRHGSRYEEGITYESTDAIGCRSIALAGNGHRSSEISNAIRCPIADMWRASSSFRGNDRLHGLRDEFGLRMNAHSDSRKMVAVHRAGYGKQCDRSRVQCRRTSATSRPSFLFPGWLPRSPSA